MLRGVVPPVVTPFTAEGTLDLAAFEANLEAYAAWPLAGYLVLGSNGETASLEESEKLSLLRCARQRSRGRLLLAGTGLESTRATIEFTRRAADAGADAALVLTPHYFRPQMTSEALRRHYEAVADAAPVPVLLYSVPVYTGLALAPELSVQLSAHPRIVGLKDSSGDLAALGRVLAGVPSSFALACGSLAVFYPALCLGAPAGILALACCAPGAVGALYEAFVRGEHSRARRLQAALAAATQAITGAHGVAGLKAAMDAAGLRGGHVRAPLLDLGPHARAALGEVLAGLARESALAGAGDCG